MKFKVFVFLCLFTQIFAVQHDDKKTLIIVGTAWTMSKYIHQAAEELGYTPVLLVDMNGYSSQVMNAVQQNKWFQINVGSYEEIEQFLENHWDELGNVEAITSLTDMRLPIARRLADHFGVKGPDIALLKLSDKSWVSGLIPEYSPKTIHFIRRDMPLHTIHQMIDTHGSVVIKPTKGSGALGTIILDQKLSQKEIEALLMAHFSDLDTLEWIAQACIEGTLYSMEGYCKNGIAHFLGLNRRSRLKMSEMTSQFPSDHDLLIQNHSSIIYNAMQTLIERSQFDHGYFHTEFLVNETGAYLIDANFGRIGGGAIIEQLAYSFAISPVDIAKHVLDVGLFDGELNPYKNQPRPSMCLCYGSEHEGVFQQVHLPQDMQSPHTLVAKENAHLAPIGDSDYAWVGMLAGDPKQILKEVQSITIQTSEGIVPARYYVD